MNDSTPILFAPIFKVDPVKQEVTGFIAEEAADKTREMFDYETGKVAVSDWSNDFKKRTDGKSLGNVRSMHGNHAAGKLTDLQFDDSAKKIMVTAKIVDRAEFEKCLEGVYTGFSIGGSYSRKWDDPTLKGVQRYTPRLSEVSLVDNPCMYGATFTAVKSDGSEEIRKFIGGASEGAVDLSTGGLESVGAIRDALSKAETATASWCARLVVAAKRHGVNVNPHMLFSESMDAVTAKILPPYACGAERHFHFTKRSAETCIAQQVETVTKGLYYIGPLSDSVDQINHFAASIAIDDVLGKGTSELPDKLKLVKQELTGILSDLSDDDRHELLASAKGAFIMGDVVVLKNGTMARTSVAYHTALSKQYEAQASINETMSDWHARMAQACSDEYVEITGKALTTEELTKSMEKPEAAAEVIPAAEPVAAAAEPVAETIEKVEAVEPDALTKALNVFTAKLDELAAKQAKQDETNLEIAKSLQAISKMAAPLPGARVSQVSKAADNGAEPEAAKKTPLEMVKSIHAGS